MRRVVAAVCVVFAFTQAGMGQVATVPAVPGTGQAVPTLAPLVKKVTPSVVNIAIKGRVAQEQNPLLNDPFFRRFFNLPDIPAEREWRIVGPIGPVYFTERCIGEVRLGLRISDADKLTILDELKGKKTRMYQMTVEGYDHKWTRLNPSK